MKKLFCLLWVCLLPGCVNSNKTFVYQNNQIVIINTGLHNRIGISKQINLIKSLNPKVIAIDLFFDKEVNQYQDSLLMTSLKGYENFVMAVLLKDNGIQSRDKLFISGTIPKFRTAKYIGYTNVLLEDSDPPLLKRFFSYDSIENKIVYHLSVQTAMLYDSAKTANFLNNNYRIIDIRYFGNQEIFKMYSASDVLNGSIPREEIEDKIIIMGYAGPYEYFPIDRYDEDKFYTPLNLQPTNSPPDMYGVVYLANIVKQILFTE